jgi:hypothetical protein
VLDREPLLFQPFLFCFQLCDGDSGFFVFAVDSIHHDLLSLALQ